MSSTKKISFASVLVLAAILVAVVAGYLVSTQRSAAEKLREDYARSAAQAASLTGSVLQGDLVANQAYARKAFGGDRAQVQAALRTNSLEEGIGRNVVLAADGRVLAFYPDSLTAADLSAKAGVRPAQPGRATYSNLLSVRRNDLFTITIPFLAAEGIRTWTFGNSVEELAVFTRGYLAGANQLQGGGAFIVDANSRVVASSRGDELARPLPDTALTEAIRRTATGVVGPTAYASAMIPNSPWLMVFTAPAETLLQPVEAPRVVAWRLFALFVLILVGLLVLAAVTLDRSSRLAHARLHDALTGLPHRQLFLDRTRDALDRRSQRGGEVAVLFIDLDEFKAVNDNFGHGVGDALLVAVAARLQATVRPIDVVSRFGGDEFLVLCTEVATMEDAVATAGRVQVALASPFRIGEHEHHIGSSIGVVVSGQFGVADASLLIHAADIAMYQAKRGAIVRYRVEMTGAKR